MRYTMYAMIIAILVACCATSAMAAGSWLWPFGGQQRAEGAPAVTPEQPKEDRSRTSPAAARRLASSPPHREMHVPHPTLPSFPSLWPSKNQSDQVRNAWAKPAAEPGQASPWQVVTDSAHRLSTSTRNAWNKTVDALKPSGGKDASVAQHQPRPSFWSGWFRPEDQKPQGPRTVTEWMAQQRLDP